jgi:hypothetical protein
MSMATTNPQSEPGRKPPSRRTRRAPSSTPRSQSTVEVRTKAPAAAPRPSIEPRTLVYASVGVGDVALSALREATGKVLTITRDPGEIQREMQSLSERLGSDMTKVFERLAERGEHLLSSIQSSSYSKRAVEQAKVARSQAKAARTSVRKAVDTATVAVKEAASRIG